VGRKITQKDIKLSVEKWATDFADYAGGLPGQNQLKDLIPVHLIAKQVAAINRRNPRDQWQKIIA